ncbi:MAG: baseplate multidomain protein megatron [Hyphomicrobium sp.]
MATLALAAVGSAVGGSLLPAGLGAFGATLSGAAIGSQLGALGGAFVDNALFGSSGQTRAVEGPRLTDLHVTASTEGAPITRCYGRVRIGGQIIWASDFEEAVVTTSQASGSGKGGFGGGAGETGTVTEYRYYANFAVALAEGRITRLGRVWADGREFDLNQTTWRLYKGTETQQPDSLIQSVEGAAATPAYRGLAYIVFEHMALASFGNRLPQLSFEVFRSVDGSDDDIRAIVLIPGSGEFAYAVDPVWQPKAAGVNTPENVHTLLAPSDWAAAVDQLENELVNARRVSLIVSWFGTDLRAGTCEIKPGVENTSKVTEPLTWRVAGETRATAHVVSTRDGRPAYGGTPSDQTVIAALRDLKQRGFDVTLTPFVLMDVAEGNVLSNPYGGTGQPLYPWRGRITCHPAPGQPGSPDKTAAVASQIAAFVGTAAVAHFAISGDSVVYSGPNEWSYRRMVLHQAHLAKAAGGVAAFLIGTELRGLTWVRSAAATYPFVAALIALANDVRTVLGPATKIVYAADWSEYFGHQPADGSNDVYFHLDPLWASANIDAIGIDVYWPLADWREVAGHLDALQGYTSTYDLAYLRSNVRGGEGYDWYYASEAGRNAQTRLPINDALGKPWVYRYKDIKSWWLNAHYNRPGGVESVAPTAWVPQSKPFWLMEIGCPAVDKGANQPNVFVDPKSSESAYPYYSRRTRDDFMQRRFIRALIEAFDWTKDGYLADGNPVSALTGQRMVDLDRMYVYCWDARPYPAFPEQQDVWGDGANWTYGHWINGRLGAAPLPELVAAITHENGFEDIDVSGLAGTVPGYVVDRVMAARDALQPLELAYFFDSIETGGHIAFRHRGSAPAVFALTGDDLVEERAGDALLTLTRGQETELPASAKLRFIAGDDDYRQGVAEARRLIGASGRVAEANLPIVLDQALAGAMSETWLFESWAARERASFKLPPSALALEPGDVVSIADSGLTRAFRVTDISEHGVREIDALSIDPTVYIASPTAPRPASAAPIVQVGSPAGFFLDLPLLTGSETPEAGYVAASQTPWPGAVAFYASPQTTGYMLKALVTAAATTGATLDAIAVGVEGRVDWSNAFRVRLSHGALASADVVSVLGGANAAAIRNDIGQWEIVQFLNADLVDVATYRLSGLLRAQAGTDGAMRATMSSGAPFVLLDAAVTPVPQTLNDLNLPLNWRFGPANRPLGDSAYLVTSHAFSGAGLLPLSPAHVRATRNSAGDATLTWRRRTRIGGDTWESADVPLGETSERYETDILSGATVVRTLATTAPGVTYSAADQTSDFGSPQATLSVAVHQIGSLGGRGTARVAHV